MSLHENRIESTFHAKCKLKLPLNRNHTQNATLLGNGVRKSMCSALTDCKLAITSYQRRAYEKQSYYQIQQNYTSCWRCDEMHIAMLTSNLLSLPASLYLKSSSNFW